MARKHRPRNDPAPAERQTEDAERIILADVRRHRVMRGYSSEGQLFEIGAGPEKNAELKRCGKELTKLLAQQRRLKLRQEDCAPTTSNS